VTRARGEVPDDHGRRVVLVRAVGAGIGAALAGVAAPSAAAAKLAKSAVQYTDAGTVKDQDCDDCAQFIAGKSANAPGTCRIVEGAISPDGHCIAFVAKPRR
jgi:hypothetical protein